MVKFIGHTVILFCKPYAKSIKNIKFFGSGIVNALIIMVMAIIKQ